MSIVSQWYGRLRTDAVFFIDSGFGNANYSSEEIDAAPLFVHSPDQLMFMPEGQFVWVGLRLAVHQDAPDDDTDEWEVIQHATVSFQAEGYLGTSEGGHGYDGTLKEFGLPAGDYNVRAVSRGRDESRFVTWGGADQPTDPALLPEQIRIDFWPI